MNIKESILKFLRDKGTEVTAYQVAKELNIAWSTANYHLIELVAEGKVKKRVEERFGSKKCYYSLNV